MTLSNGSIFCITGPLCGKFTSHQWIPPRKGQWCRALMFSLICTWTNRWINNRDTGGLRCNRAYYDITVMKSYPRRPMDPQNLINFCVFYGGILQNWLGTIENVYGVGKDVCQSPVMQYIMIHMFYLLGEPKYVSQWNFCAKCGKVLCLCYVVKYPWKCRADSRLAPIQ